MAQGYDQAMDFETRAIHGGQEPDPATGAITTPIYQTSTYVQDAVGKNKGYDYSRSGNPTRTALETCLASLESADHGLAFSSGLGATTTIMHLVNPGERVVCVNDVYGGVYRMFSQVYEPKGYGFTFLSAEEITSRPRRAPRREDARRLARVADEPAPERDRHRGRGRGGARRRRARGRGQHLRHAVPAAAARARRRHRRPLDDEVPRRTLGRDRRLRGDERPDGRGAAALPAEVPGRGPRPLRLLARAARREDARGAHAPALRERAPDRGLPRGARGRRARLLPRPPRPPRPRRSRRGRWRTSAA